VDDAQTIIARVGATIASTLTIDEVLSAIARQVCEAFGVASADVFASLSRVALASSRPENFVPELTARRYPAWKHGHGVLGWTRDEIGMHSFSRIAAGHAVAE